MFFNLQSVVMAMLAAVLVSNVSQARKIPLDIQEKWKKVVEPYHQTCINETHIDPDAVISMLTDSRLPSERSIHCYWKCILEHLKFLVDGEFNIDLMNNQVYLITPEVSKPCIQIAFGEKEVCKRIYTFVQCGMNAAINSI
ncbi:uncharacterized protein LOC116172442 [Photinus pyralis]|uniref:uncharacterized protein LOC116172442 n=1 Tax=Photinus pyralis TaxID=7054 RepID=UPI00126715CD|nr:uncharacterized protein LOC116172442 [Photinus pyralis]